MSQHQCFLHKEEPVPSENTCEDCNKPICSSHTHGYLEENDATALLCPVCYEVRLENEKKNVEMNEKSPIINIVLIVGFIGVVALLLFLSSYLM